METKRVLVADDDATIGEMLKSGLEVLGYEVVTANSGSEIKNTLGRIRPDLILMDVSMPGADGISICRDIRLSPETHDIPIIILTAFTDGKTFHDAMLFGATDFLTKPFDFSEVLKKVQESLAKVQSKKENKK